jgi:hypothetical protein
VDSAWCSSVDGRGRTPAAPIPSPVAGRPTGEGAGGSHFPSGPGALGTLRARASLWGLLIVAFVAGGMSGCRHFGVRAHQRELLADRIMSLEGNVQERAADEHVLSNREGAVGGTGTAGGGCGCN